MKRQFGFLMVLVLSLSVWACTNTAPKKELNVRETNVITETATVEKINMKKRVVTLRGSEGRIIKIHAGEEVVNLPQVRVGDKLVVEYIASTAVRMGKPGEVMDDGVKMMASRAKPGDKPGYMEAFETTDMATILDLDRARMTATLKFSDGDVEVINVKDPANMDKVKVGDSIVITYTDGIAVSIREKTK